MSESITCILIIGGTSGIGEAFARRFYAMGKSVIITGRRGDRLKSIATELPGIHTRVMDNAKLTSLRANVHQILSEFPDVNTVWINSGIQKAYSFLEAESADLTAINEEVDVNLTAPMIITRLVVPHLVSLKDGGNLILTSSALAFVPLGVYPVYCPTKAAIHAFAVGIRQQLIGTQVNVLELVPPYVGTELDIHHRGVTVESSMPLLDYTNAVFEILDNSDVEEINELAVGFADTASKTWRQSIGKIMAAIGVGG